LRAGGVIQAVEHLPSKHEVLSSTPVLPKTKSKIKKNIELSQFSFKADVEKPQLRLPICATF
jgi:hypothetical protein